MNLSMLQSLSYDQRLALLKKLERLKTERRNTNRIERLYPAEGPLSRDRYPKFLEFFEAGPQFSQRAIIAANRVGKSFGVGGYETTLHLTGNYPDWWNGRRFDHPISAWAAGDTNETTRDIIQQILTGVGGEREGGELGTGLIPLKSFEGEPSRRSGGVSGAFDTIAVKHASGGVSRIGLKSFDQGRKKFQGTSKHLVWLDEEPPQDIYTECLTRILDCAGMILLSFTPLEGISDVVKDFMPHLNPERKEDPENEKPTRFYTQVGWEDVPHLGEKEKAELEASYPTHQKDARTKGIPLLGAGAIYPIPRSEIEVKPFQIPAHWKKAYALDVGWNKTAVLWGAKDMTTDTIYLWSEHYRGQALPIVHARAIKARGEWIRGAIDPAANGRSQRDGEQLIADYRSEGLHVVNANNALEAGIFQVWQRLETGRLKVFSTLQAFWTEFLTYSRDESGKVIKKNNHLMDDMRYLVMTWDEIASYQPSEGRIGARVRIADRTAGY